MSAFPDHSEFLVVLIPIVFSAIILWDEAWGIPMVEVASLPLLSLITFLLYSVSLHLFEKLTSLEKGSA